ncbi:MAG: DUF5606 domain-containing protein [Bacteroidaceae bacterium]|nr:DUF5606 domain-containing protein [Bacteroidaceae bacterium]
MIKKILAIAGKPGLYKLISRGNKSLIVETVDEQKKRIPAFGTDRVVSLGDISIYTDDDKEVSLASVFQSIKNHYDSKVVPLSPKKADQADIIDFFAKVLPNYDTDRVRVSDMRKVLAWYNILVEYGITDFEVKEEAAQKQEEEAAEEEAPKAAAPLKKG